MKQAKDVILRTPGSVAGQQLTPNQVDRFQSYKKRFESYGLQTGPTDRENAMRCLRNVYLEAKMKPLSENQYHWVESPLAGAKLVRELMKKDHQKGHVDLILDCGMNQHDCGWLAFYAYYAIECNLESAKPVIPLTELCQYVGWWWPFDTACVVSDRPKTILFDQDGKVHADGDQPAMIFSDGFGVRIHHGDMPLDKPSTFC